MRHFTALNGLLLILLVPCTPAIAQDEEPEFTDEFPLEDCYFKPWGGNPYFSLKPGRQLYLSNQRCVAADECDELEEVWITVTSRLKKIRLPLDNSFRYVWTRVVEERETADGELKEVSRNFFADCGATHDVYYFGEDVDDYEDGKIVGHSGAWLTGRHGAMPGIIMPESAFILGSRYFQEVAPGVALDRAEHVATGEEVEVPAGVFEGCVEVTETTPLGPGEESTKVYCRGIGLVIDDDLELHAIYGGDNDDD
jgi:hypothetical protein